MSGDPGVVGRDPGVMSAEPRVAIVDHGAGNLVSIGNALQLLGAEVRIAATPEALEDADVIVMPGVGASAPAMRRLRRRGLAEPSSSACARVPGTSASAWACSCSSSARTRTARACWRSCRATSSPSRTPPRLPHIGWNRLEIRRHHPVLDGLADGTPAYFVHSYAPVPADADDIVAETEHGGRFASLIARDRIVGFQFHPERSGDDGLRMLANCLELVRGSGRAAREPRSAPASGAASGMTAGARA